MHHPGPQPDGHTRRRGLTRAITFHVTLPRQQWESVRRAAAATRQSSRERTVAPVCRAAQYSAAALS